MLKVNSKQRVYAPMYRLILLWKELLCYLQVQVALPCCCVEAEAAKLARRRLVLILKAWGHCLDTLSWLASGLLDELCKWSSTPLPLLLAPGA